MIVSGLDQVIDAFEAGWEAAETELGASLSDGFEMPGASAEYWWDGRYFAQAERNAAAKVAEGASSDAHQTNPDVSTSGRADQIMIHAVSSQNWPESQHRGVVQKILDQALRRKVRCARLDGRLVYLS
ncbi:hypothetical protein [Sphingomonas sp. BAUL-RG-20F-R05-02]|uniref:hypothetical protein n=1 Tax=Sphingomonas sp. BAUL-RG-20F-R05-02 TaxID=2914830 RepID=UPI001F56F44C|nr:hypothetical protein [Sphingomonas sp. BAUL-RG-20F-R05-02]